jgi:hypothetical protein
MAQQRATDTELQAEQDIYISPALQQIPYEVGCPIRKSEGDERRLRDYCVEIGYHDGKIFTVVVGIEKTRGCHRVAMVAAIVEEDDSHFVFAVRVCEFIELPAWDGMFFRSEETRNVDHRRRQRWHVLE